jgi:arylformamidase
MLPRDVVDPDHQMPMPFQAAEDYAQTVMAWAQEPLPERVVYTPGLAYGSHRLQRYDVYAPAGAQAAGVLVFWHGGGWTNGYRAYQRFMAPHVTARGLVLVAPSYRLVPEHPLPAAVDDAVALLQALQRDLPALGGDPRRLVLAGHSAGGHVATMAALRTDLHRLAQLPEDAVRGCMPISGIMDLHHPSPAPGSLEERVYTMVLRDPAEDAAMSPICWTRGNTLPMLLTVGAGDSERVVRSNARLEALLALQPGPVERQVLAGHDHFRTHTMLRDPDHAWYGRLEQLHRKGTP